MKPYRNAPIDGCIRSALKWFLVAAIFSLFLWIPYEAHEEIARGRHEYLGQLLYFGFYVAGFCFSIFWIVEGRKR